MTMTWLGAVDKIRSARNKAYGKPLANNTRLYERGEGDEREFGIVLHGTEVVTVKPDGTYVLRAGGYQTMTTLDRIRTYSPATWQTLLTDRGDWYVRLEPDPSDPRPERVNRTVPKPYQAENPGPEPVKNMTDCIAGQLVATEHVNETVQCYRRNMQAGDELVEVISDGYQPGGDYDTVKVIRSWTDHVYIGEAERAYYDQGWGALEGNRSHYSESFSNADGETVKYIQCSHCKAFDAKHEAWRQKMHGDRWGRSFDRQTGYATYAEMIEHFGSMEAWQAAYIADYRARRAYLKADREWDQRNRVPFYDGITIDSEGYAPRLRMTGPSPAKLRRHEAAVAKMKKRIDKYVEGYIAALKAGMPMPSGGDCWYCALHTSVTDSDTQLRVPMGDAVSSHEHLISHMEDRYYVPTLAVNALRERGYRDVGIAIYLDMDFDSNTMGKPNGLYDNTKRDLIKYMRKRLVPQPPTE
jgi:hypothetical protein